MEKSSRRSKNSLFSNIKHDLPASIVVFFVALPLCLGIALASGTPLVSGLIAGIVGGIIVGSISKSALGVSGPAAGLAIIVLTAITNLGSFEAFLVAGVIAGFLQIVFGLVRAGKIASLFPSSVITGMLTGIGIIIFLKQIPHLLGYDADAEGDFSFFQTDGETTFSEFGNAINYFTPGAIIVAAISLFILIFWQFKIIQKNKVLSFIPAPLLAVIVSILLAKFFNSTEALAISSEHFVNIPIFDNWASMQSQLSFPDWSYLFNGDIWVIAITIAVVASIETLLCVEATDKLDPHYKTSTPMNRELIAQGVGNMLACAIGGMPITQVIVRSSANIQSGGKTKLSAIMHGFWLISTVLTIPFILNMIPIATLAAILTLVGYKLAKPSTFTTLYRQGWIQFLPFIVTVVFMLFTDLLTGVAIGFACSLLLIFYNTYLKSPNIDRKQSSTKKLKRYTTYIDILNVSEQESEGKRIVKINLINNVTFLSKLKLQAEFNKVERKSVVIIDTRNASYIHPDVMQLLVEFEVMALHKQIRYQIIKE